MAYVKTNWAARIREYANRVVLTATGGTNEYDITQVEGTITTAGTPISPANLQNMDDQIELLSDEILEDSRSVIQTTQKPVDTFDTGTLESKILAQIKGSTTVNLLEDDVAGCEATTGWTASNITLSTDSSNEFEGTNCLKMTLTDTSGYIRRDVLSKLDITKYYLISAYFKNNDLATGTLIKLDTDDVDISGSSEDGSTYIRQGIIIQPTDIDAATYAYLTIQEDGASAEYGFVDAITLQEISATEYALGASAVMERYPFHRNIESSTPDFETVGKNLFAKNKAELNKNVESDGTLITLNGRFTSEYIKVKSNTQYTGFADSYRTAFYDSNKTFISDSVSSATKTTPINCTYLRTSYLMTLIDSFQLETGTSATDYVPHKPNTFTPGITLRSVPSARDILCNAVVDATDSTKLLPMDGWTLDTGIEVDTISDTDYNSHDTATYTNVDVTKTTTTILDLVGTIGVDGATIMTDKNGEAMIEVSQSNIDLATSDGKYYVHTDKSIWYLTTAGTYADIAAARTGLGTTTVQFEKETPVITQPTLDEIFSFENGTLYQNQTVMAEVDYTVVKNYKAIVDSNTEVIEKIDDEIAEMQEDLLLYGKYSQMSGGSVQTEGSGYITFTTEDNDDFNAIDIGTSNTRMTIPSDVTVIEVYFKAKLITENSDATVRVYKNGVEEEIIGFYSGDDSNITEEIQNKWISLPITVSENDYIEIYATVADAPGSVVAGGVAGFKALK